MRSAKGRRGKDRREEEVEVGGVDGVGGGSEEGDEARGGENECVEEVLWGAS